MTAIIVLLSLLVLSCLCPDYEYGLLGGKEVNVTSALEAPFLILKSDHANLLGNNKYEGYTMDLLSYMAGKLRCKFFMNPLVDGRMESMPGETDMLIGGHTITSQKELVIDMSVPFMHVGISLLAKKPSRWEVSIDSVEELVRQNKITFGIWYRGTAGRLIKNSRVATYQRIWESYRANNDSDLRVEDVTSNKEGLQKVLDGDGRYAFFMDSAKAEYHVATNCQLKMVGKPVNHMGYGVMLMQGSAYREEVNIALLELRQEGVLDQIKERWFAPTENSCPNENWTQFLWNLLPSF